MAKTYNCKYTEVSSLMGLKTDTLLAGMVRQVDLHKCASGNQRNAQYSFSEGTCGAIAPTLEAAAMIMASFVRVTESGRILFRKSGMRRSRQKRCDNLLVL